MIADQVDVVMTVKDQAYLQRLKTDERAFLATMGAIEASADRAGNALANVGNRGAAGLAATAKQTQILANNTGNLAAQFSDIGVQLAGGQSPFLIALQQGSQINQVLGQAGARGAVQALAGAFASMINPVSLATIALIALGGTAIQYFTSVNTDGKSSTEVIKEQNEAIRKVAESWGDAVPALKAYVDELDRAEQAATQGEAREGFAAAQFRAADEAIQPLMERLAGLKSLLMEIGVSGTDINELSAAFNDLDRKINDQTATAEDAQRVSEALAAFVGGPGADAVAHFGAQFPQLAALVTAAAKALAEFNAQANAAIGGSATDSGDAYRDRQEAQFQFVREQERINGLTSEQLSLENEIARIKAEYARENEGMVLDDAVALDQAQKRLSAEERRAALLKATRAGGAAASDAERERKAVLDLIAALQFEQGLIGLTNAEKAVQNALRRAGAAATDEERLAIEELITATYAETEALAAAEAAMGAFENMAGNALGTFLNDIRQGKDAAESLSNVFDDIAGQLIQMAAQGLVRAAFGGLFGGGGGGLFGGLFGGRGFASGTANTGGNRGEPRGIVHGQEAVIPLPSGGKVPVQIQGGNGSGSGGSVQVMVSLDDKMLRAEIVQVSGEVSAATVSEYNRNLSTTMAEKQLRQG